MALEKGVGFVNEQCGLHFFNHAKEGGGADVGGNDRAIHEFAQDAEEGGFAATFDGRFDAEVGADVAELEAPGVDDPERERFGRVFGQDDEAGKEGGQVVKESGIEL